MNTGLKNYTKQLTQAIGNAANVSVNINEEDANLLVALPLLKTIGLSPIELSLIYNHQNKNEEGLFGRGTRLNLFSKLIIGSDRITMENADGSSDVYLSSNGYKNTETQTTIEKVYEDNYQLTYHYKVTDKFGNYKLYSPNNLEYPYCIKTTGNDTFTLDFIASTKVISNNKGDTIEFLCINGVVDEIIYKHNGTQLYVIMTRLTDDGFLRELMHYKENTIVASSVIEYDVNKIIVSDSISNYRIKYTLSGNKVISFVDTYGQQFDESRSTSITYEGHKTTITDFKGNKVYEFFDNNNMLLFEMDSEGNVIETEYDATTKALTAQSSVIRTKNKQANLFPTNSVINFTRDSGVSISGPYSVNSSFFNTILGGTVCKLTGNGKLTYSVNCKGLATDNVQAIIWGRQLTNYSPESHVDVTLTTDGADKDSFKKTVIDDNFDLMTLGSSATKSYSNITLTIELFGNASIEIGGVQVLKKDFGTFFEYDDSGNSQGQTSGTGSSRVIYNSKNQAITSQDTDSTMYDFKYDSKGNLLQAKTAYGVVIENEYDSNNKLIKNKIKKNSVVIENEITYDENGLLTSEKDELGNQTTYKYDSFGKVIEASNALYAVTKYNYDVYDNLKQIILQKGSDKISANYQYDSKQRLISVSLENGSYYNFEYDSMDNMVKVKLNSTTIFKYEYDSDNALILQQYGEEGDAFKFEYNTNKELIKVYYVTPNKVSSLRYSYEYNSLHQLQSIKNASGVILNNYTYDNDGNIVKMTSNNQEINYQYDNLGNVNEKTIAIGGKKIHQSYDNISRSKGSSPEAIVDTLGGMSQARVATFVSDLYARGKKEPVSCKAADNIESTATLSRDGVIPCVNLSSSASKRITYLLPDDAMPYTSGMVAFWFKPTDVTTKQYLFCQKQRAGTGFIGVYLHNSKLYVEVTNYQGTAYTFMTSDMTVKINEWNFFSLDYIYRNDTGFSADYISQFDLVLNSNRQVLREKTSKYYFDQGINTVYHIGHAYDNSSYYDFLKGKIALVMIGNNRYIDTQQILNYYRTTKDYIIDNQMVDNNVSSVDFSQTNLHTINPTIQNSFEIYPLQTSVVSLNGKKPVAFDLRTVTPNDKDRTFNFNNQNKHYAYVADGSSLEYDFGLSQTGTVMMRAFTDVDNNKQYFFEAKDSSGQILALYRDEYGKLCIDMNGKQLISTLKFKTNIWQTVGLSFDTEIQTDSQATITYNKLRIYLDGSTYEFKELVFFNYSQLTFMIGRTIGSERIISDMGLYFTVHPLYGQIEMLATRNSYSEISVLNLLKEELKDYSKVSEFDEIGLLQKVDIHHSGQRILSNTYSYKYRADSVHASKQIAGEVIRYGSKVVNRLYTTDALGNVTNVSDSVFGSHSYAYDYRGFLTKEDNTVYTYDKNGNITSAGSDRFTYDPVIKDRLATVNGISIVYSPNNPGNPMKYNGKDYKFEGRRLKSISSSDSYGGEEVAFEYNDQGLRIKKVKAEWFNDDRDMVEEVTNYFYDGDKLITQICGSLRFDFLYDENGQLYGFIKNNETRYFYIRDFMQNIHGIVDVNGTLVVRYEYDAYGNILHTIDTSGLSIGLYNPFRYKGYYYDKETDMYYCKSRYYVPKWRRWLNNDATQYLDPSNEKNINLFTYCWNNPLVFTDSNGNMPKWLKYVLGGVVVAAAVAITACTFGVGAAVGTVVSGVISGTVAAMNAQDDEDKIGAFIGGAINGTFSALAIAFGAGAAVKAGLYVGAVVSGGGGFIAGIFGNMYSQYVSYNNIDFGVALVTGFINGMSTAATTTFLIQSPLDIVAETIRDTIANALKFSFLGASVGVYLSSFVPNLNDKRQIGRY